MDAKERSEKEGSRRPPTKNRPPIRNRDHYAIAKNGAPGEDTKIEGQMVRLIRVCTKLMIYCTPRVIQLIFHVRLQAYTFASELVK